MSFSIICKKKISGELEKYKESKEQKENYKRNKLK